MVEGSGASETRILRPFSRSCFFINNRLNQVPLYLTFSAEQATWYHRAERKAGNAHSPSKFFFSQRTTVEHKSLGYSIMTTPIEYRSTSLRNHIKPVTCKLQASNPTCFLVIRSLCIFFMGPYPAYLHRECRTILGRTRPCNSVATVTMVSPPPPFVVGGN